MARKTPHSRQDFLASSQGIPQLLHSVDAGGIDVESALREGIVQRSKVTGRWLYFRSQAVFEEGRKAVKGAAELILQGWLLVPAPILASTIPSRLASVGMDRGAAELLLRTCLRTGGLDALGLLTVGRYEPYLGIFSDRDRPEIKRQCAAMLELAHRQAHVRGQELPSPEHPRTSDAWRSTVLRHGEFLGLGGVIDGALVC